MQQKWPADRVERRPISSLKPAPRNARTHSDEQVRQIAESMREWGWTVPVLVDEGGSVIAGHGRLMAAGHLGLTEVPVMVAEGWTEAQKRAYLIADNQLVLNAGWDIPLLASDVAELREWDFDISLLGFEDLDALLAADKPSKDDGAVEPPSVPSASVGDVWIMGPHRLYVGDSKIPPADAEDAHLVVFDPPFDQNYSDWSLPPTNVIIVWGRGDRRIRFEAKHFAIGSGYGLHELVITGGVRGQPRPELPCLVHDVIHVWRKRWWHGGGKPIDGALIKKIEWQKTKDDRPYSHNPNCGGVLTGLMSWGKPVVAMEVLLCYGPRGSKVYDPCAGSGSMLIACERHGRIFVGCENQPQWADLCVTRWQKETGREAVLEATGESHAATAVARGVALAA
jgi:hypothetical protein